VAIPLEHSTGR